MNEWKIQNLPVILGWPFFAVITREELPWVKKKTTKHPAVQKYKTTALVKRAHPPQPFPSWLLHTQEVARLFCVAKNKAAKLRWKRELELIGKPWALNISREISLWCLILFSPFGDRDKEAAVALSGLLTLFCTLCSVAELVQIRQTSKLHFRRHIPVFTLRRWLYQGWAPGDKTDVKSLWKDSL